MYAANCCAFHCLNVATSGDAILLIRVRVCLFVLLATATLGSCNGPRHVERLVKAEEVVFKRWLAPKYGRDNEGGNVREVVLPRQDDCPVGCEPVEVLPARRACCIESRLVWYVTSESFPNTAAVLGRNAPALGETGRTSRIDHPLSLVFRRPFSESQISEPH